MKQLILTLAISTIIIGAHPLTMSAPAQGATGQITSCKSEYDLGGTIWGGAHFTVIKGALYFNERPCLPLRPVGY